MLQSSLESTFRLKFHMEQREIPAYNPDAATGPEQGQKVDKPKRPVEMLVIDSVSKPSENDL